LNDDLITLLRAKQQFCFSLLATSALPNCLLPIQKLLDENVLFNVEVRQTLLLKKV